MQKLATRDEDLLAQAVTLGFSCPPSDKAYSVGAVIATPDGRVVATGYSREGDESGHAEEIAITKARRAGADVRGATIYSSLEPCHPRLSGKTSCAQHIIETGIVRVIFCFKEPPHFVQCEGSSVLKNAGIEVLQDESLAARVQEANRFFFPE